MIWLRASTGVPDIAPVAVLNVNSWLRAGVMLKVLSPNPPEAVTGINACDSRSSSRDLEAIDCNAVSAGGSSTVNRKVSVAV
jgi:hypothetical protein